MKTAFFLLTAWASLAAADWQFRSRPDLAPPRLNITIPADLNLVEKGYLFLAPFAGYPDTPTEQHGPRQAGPYIFRDNGDLVWSGYGLYSIWATNFQAGRWWGKDVLFSFEGDHNAGYGHGHGHVTIMDQHYETIRELRAGNHKLVDKHEFHIVNEETGLIQIYQPVPRDLSEFGAKEGQQWIVDAIFQELDISTGRLLFEWSSLSHISPDESVLPINPGQAGSGYNSSDAWDYFHINSVDKNPSGTAYLLSARDACSIVKVNATSGEVIWRLHGKRSDFKMGKKTKFCFQHHARWLSDDIENGVEVISLYDNAAHGTEHGEGREVHTAEESSGKILKLDTKKWTAELVRGYYPPEAYKLLSKSQGSTQVLPNENVLVNWGSEGAITEYTKDGKPIFHAWMDSGELGVGVENYRGFRFNWTGLPNEEPAVVALIGEDEKTRVYASWNGDTETDTWRFYEVVSRKDRLGSSRKTRFLGEEKRKGFETEFVVPEGREVEGVVAEAVDKYGKVLRVTGTVAVESEVLPDVRTGEALSGGHKNVGEDQTVLGLKDKAAASSRWEEYSILKLFRFVKDL
ncbi:ASST-domain-containing protein [Apiosordaria backusii]|uniref:ASST-domain-containing protein n=1 Tax=Apiosordaria backusii TaxID=314023 RepID=A0AA40BSG5_9PEZI|nr:ASST-domain-containing protein [Apiosordaria backusii]